MSQGDSQQQNDTSQNGVAHHFLEDDEYKSDDSLLNDEIDSLIGDLQQQASDNTSDRIVKKQKYKSKQLISISLDRKQSKQCFEEDKLFQLCLKQLNPTQFRMTLASQYLQNKKLSKMNIGILTQQSLSILLSEGMQENHYSLKTIKSLKQHLKQGLIKQQHYRKFFLIASGAHVEISQNKGYYHSLTQQTENYPKDYFDKILQDSVRTGVINSTLSDLELKIFQEKLNRVLTAYAIRNPYVRYCQGMNYIVMFLLKHITEGCEEEAFWILVQLLECTLSLEMYTNPQYFIYFLSIFEEYLKQISPEIMEKFKATSTQFLVFPFNEIFSLFCNCLQPNISAVILMNMILHGQRVLISGLTSLLLIAKQQILKSKNYCDINIALTSLKEFDNVEVLQSQIIDLYINKRAFTTVTDIYSLLNQDSKQKILNKKQKEKIEQISCNIKSPVCESVNLMIKDFSKGFSYFIYKEKQPIIVSNWNHFHIHKTNAQQEFNGNYLHQNNEISQQNRRDHFYESQQNEESKQSLHQSNQPSLKDPIININDLIIGRFNHICSNSKKEYRLSRSSLLVSGMASPKNIRKKNKTQMHHTYLNDQFASEQDESCTQNEILKIRNRTNASAKALSIAFTHEKNKKVTTSISEEPSFSEKEESFKEEVRKKSIYLLNDQESPPSCTQTEKINGLVTFLDEDEGCNQIIRKKWVMNDLLESQSNEKNQQGNIPQLSDEEMQKLENESYFMRQSQSLNRQRTKQVYVPSDINDEIIEFGKKVCSSTSINSNENSNNLPQSNNMNPIPSPVTSKHSNNIELHSPLTISGQDNFQNLQKKTSPSPSHSHFTPKNSQVNTNNNKTLNMQNSSSPNQIKSSENEQLFSTLLASQRLKLLTFSQKNAPLNAMNYLLSPNQSPRSVNSLLQQNYYSIHLIKERQIDINQEMERHPSYESPLTSLQSVGSHFAQ